MADLSKSKWIIAVRIALICSVVRCDAVPESARFGSANGGEESPGARSATGVTSGVGSTVTCGGAAWGQATATKAEGTGAGTGGVRIGSATSALKGPVFR